MREKPSSTRLFLVFLLLLGGGCGLSPDDNLTISRTPYSGRLRVDGYYEGTADSVYFRSLWFYHNGVVLIGDAYNIHDNKGIQNQWRSAQWIEGNRRYKHRWGLFQASDSSIHVEFLTKADAFASYNLHARFGTITSDTSFNLVEGDITRVYRFKPFPKPDSTNPFY